MVLFGAMVNWLAVLVGAVVAFVIGMIYYSPALFGKQWMESMPKKTGKMKMSMGSMVGALVSTLFSVFVLEVLLKALSISSLSVAIELAALVWLGFFVSMELVGLSFGSKSGKLFVINAVHHAIVLGVVVSILFYMH